MIEQWYRSRFGKVNRSEFNNKSGAPRSVGRTRIPASSLDQALTPSQDPRLAAARTGARGRVKVRMPFLFLLLAAGLLALAACTAQVKGGRAMARGDYPEAVASFREALTQSPDSLEIRRRLAAALVHAGDAPGAAGVCEEILGQAPGDPDATLYLGLALVMQGKRDEGFDRLTSYRHWQSPREQQVVADAARRLRGHPELSPEELVAEMERALELGRVAELRERNSDRFNRR